MEMLSLMQAKNISYDKLSNMTGIPKSALHRYATGQSEDIPFKKVKAIAEALNVTTDYLMGSDSNITYPTADTQFIVSRLHECLAYLEQGAEIEQPKPVTLKAPPEVSEPIKVNGGKLMFALKGYEVDFGQNVTLSNKAVGIINQVWAKTGLSSTEIIDTMLEYALANSVFN